MTNKGAKYFFRALVRNKDPFDLLSKLENLEHSDY